MVRRWLWQQDGGGGWRRRPPNFCSPLPRIAAQNLIEYISRQKIYDSVYWKQECFGLSAERLVDKAVELKEVCRRWRVGGGHARLAGVIAVCDCLL